MSEDPSPATARTIKVLLVDDQRMIGEVVRRMLQGEPDIDLHYCDDATKAVALASELRPDVILQDLILPKISGLELVTLYRANPATAATPIVILSGSDDAPTRDQTRVAGATDYVVKLPPKAGLLACIRTHAGSAP